MSEGKEVVGTGKIRESCNSCSSQKIRCGKERPSCARCASKGLVCEYAISMRTGRPSRAQSMAREAAAAAAAAVILEGKSPPSKPEYTSGPAPASDPPSNEKLAKPGLPSHSLSTSDNADNSTESVLAQMYQEMSSNDQELWMEESQNPQPAFSSDMELMYSMVPSDTQYMDLDWSLPLEMQETPGEQSMDEQHAMKSPPSNEAKTIAPRTMQTSPNATSQNPVQQRRSSIREVAEQKPRTQSRERSQRPRSPCRRAQGQQTCLASLFELALEMHIPNEACAITPSSRSNRLLHGSTTLLARRKSLSNDEPSPSPRGIDSILIQNRAAIRLLSRTLECPCSSELSVALAAYLVTSKIVGWYSAILRVETKDSDHSHTAPSTMTDHILTQPIVMGGYALDVEVHRSVRARVVLSELVTLVEPMLVKLPQFRHCLPSVDSAQSTGWSSSSSSSSSSSFMEFSSPIDQRRCALREQLRSVVGEAKRRISR